MEVSSSALTLSPGWIPPLPSGLRTPWIRQWSSIVQSWNDVYLNKFTQEPESTGHVDDPGPGLEDGEEDVGGGLCGPVVGLQSHLHLGRKAVSVVVHEGNTDVVDQDVNPPVFLLDEVPELDDGLLLTDVQLVVLGLQPLPPEGLQGGQTSSLISGGEVDVSFVLLT